MPPTMFPPGLMVGAPNALGQGQGHVTASQGAVINQNGTNAVTATLLLPPGEIQDVIVDVLVAFNSATSATLTIGTAAAGGTEIASAVSVAVAGRVRPTFTAAQLAAFVRPVETILFITVTPVGATTLGQVRATVVYETV